MAFHFLHHALGDLWRHRIGWFWPIWLTTTAFGVIVVNCALPSRKAGAGEMTSEPAAPLSRSDIAVFALFILFVACYSIGILWAVAFTYYDNSLFTLGSLAGHNIGPFIWPDEGRFFPLSLQEFNLIRTFSASAVAYHLVRIVQLVLSCALLVPLDKALGFKARLGLITVVLITPSVLISFNGLIYSEANAIVSLLCLVWCIKRFDQTRSKMWAGGAIVSAQLMLYYKETAFILIAGFAIGRLVWRCWRTDKARYDTARLRDPESILDSFLLLVVIVFLLYYLIAMYPHFGARYAVQLRLPFQQMLGSYLQIDLLAFVLILVVSIRSLLIVKGTLSPSLLWDPLALGAVFYIAGYLVLRMQSAYYLAPADVIAVLYLGHLALQYARSSVWQTTSLIAVLGIIILAQDVLLSAFRMFEAKNVVHAKALIGKEIQRRYESVPRSVFRIFFPFASPTSQMELGAYLDYRGVPIEGDPSTLDRGRTVELVGRTIQKDGLCVISRPLICHHVDKPAPGDLVVILPDDGADAADVAEYRRPGDDVLLSYSPYPPMSATVKDLIAPLRVISPKFARSSLPENFLHASVILWK